MAYKFKKQYENQTVVLADGTLIDKESINRPSVKAKINSGVWFAYMLEEAKPEEAKPEEAKPEEAKPKKRTRKK
jgi:hypothetical protein